MCVDLYYFSVYVCVYLYRICMHIYIISIHVYVYIHHPLLHKQDVT